MSKDLDRLMAKKVMGAEKGNEQQTSHLHYKTEFGILYCGDALETLRQLPDGSVQCCVTSPPYWGLRDYGVNGQLGLESTPEAYVAKMVEVFREVRRVLRQDGTLWLNL
ncbi:MAG: DNA methyltransferase, partial [Pseudomonadota bacterium]